MYHIRTREKRETGEFVERTVEAEDYNKVIYHQFRGTNKDAYLVTFHLNGKNIMKRFWVSAQPEHDPPEEMKWVHAIYVMNEDGKTLEVITN